MQCDKYNVKSVIGQMRCDRIKCNTLNKMWSIHCDKCIAKKDKGNMKNAAWQMHCDDMMSTMWKRKFEKCNVENAIQQMQCKKMNLTNVM